MAERVERIVRQYREGVYRGDIGETDIAYLISALLAAEQARDQTAPVLAAADQWADELPMETGEAGLRLMSVVLAWRAAREG